MRAVVRLANVIVVGVLYLSVLLVVGTWVVVVVEGGGDGNALELLAIVEYGGWW